MAKVETVVWTDRVKIGDVQGGVKPPSIPKPKPSTNTNTDTNKK